MEIEFTGKLFRIIPLFSTSRSSERLFGSLNETQFLYKAKYHVFFLIDSFIVSTVMVIQIPTLIYSSKERVFFRNIKFSGDPFCREARNL